VNAKHEMVNPKFFNFVLAYYHILTPTEIVVILLILNHGVRTIPEKLLINGTVRRVPIYKIDRHRANPQWTGCGLESVPSSILTLLKPKNDLIL